MSDYYFSTRDLTVGYSGKALISDINIEISKGEVLSLIGPNGAGKSTILKSITKHLEVIGGDTFIADASVGAMDYNVLARQLAVVLTDRIQGELMTCYDVVATGRYPYTGRLGILSERDKLKVFDAMSRVHAEDLAMRDFKAISDGQRQRILLARAICQEPDIIVLDEPTSFLDIRHKLELLSMLRRMAKEQGITVIMSLHEIDLAQKISDKIMCVSGDQIKYFGTPEEIFREDLIKNLYGLTNGSYDILFGSVEMPAPSGDPQVFVISAAGSGIKTFRLLQKQGIPFAAGVLYENDIDYQVAKSLACEVVSEKPFCECSPEAEKRARELIDSCKRVIDCGFPEGTLRTGLGALRDYAESLGKLEKAEI